MEKNKELIWCYHSLRKGSYDNDYIFYKDGTILHHYDRTISKLDIEEYVSPLEISDLEKERILVKCKEVCPSNIVEQIETILTTK